MPLCLEELKDCVSGAENTENALIRKEILGCINCFLDSLPEIERKVFLCRYWYLEAVKDIARRFDLAPNKTAVMLSRTRKKLQKHLDKEGLL